MPTDTAIAVSIFVAAFLFFGFSLAYASRQTDRILREKAKNGE